MKWITRERPKIDRIACPWLILKYMMPFTVGQNTFMMNAIHGITTCHYDYRIKTKI